MKEISLITFVKKNLEDDYAMNVFYQSVKNVLVEHDFSLYGFSYFFIDGRFLGESWKVTSKANYRTTVHSLSFLLSLRLLMVNHKFIKLCEDDSLLFISKPRESFQWINYMTLIMDNWDDSEVHMIFQMMENYYYDEELSDEEKEEFKNSVSLPEFRNEKKYYEYLAQQTKGVSDTVIGNNAFIEAKIEKFTISKDVVYVGNTAFAYCDNLHTLEFKGKVMFGKFPIVECNNLQKIIVPDNFVSYYRECLPFYKNIISSNEEIEIAVKTETEPSKEQTSVVDSENSKVEHVFINIPSAEPYIEVEISTEESNVNMVQEEERNPIDFKSLMTVFDKKASSYKYFWLMAIISLAKENSHLSISFSEITIRMAAMAWPLVFEDEIDLGSTDQMKKYLEEVVKRTTLIKAASSKVVENYLLQHFSSQGVDKVLAPLMKNVPYRFLSPWVKYTTDDEVMEKSCSKHFNGLYALHSNYIVLDEEWWEYIDAHYLEICDFAMKSFITYTKKFNNNIQLLKLMTSGWPLIKTK